MAKIPLRTYNREIERMIDQGQSNEAVIHCQHILKYYPKHIDTYRLLGKAYLEMQRYAEAADVLQRVLSTVPDDFISQIGLSIIREDEGNLDAAIWHMEKAFEAQPSNAAVQDELRRLYGRRDGVEPPKIRLTRGALVRMYARGELYQQAIAEIRVALAEDPQRIDLEVILARMYFLSGQPVPATEVCSRLIAKLPYCFEANRILAEILPTTSRAEDAALYQQRIQAMDPYLAFMPPHAVSSAEVPDNAVMVDKLEYIPGEEPSELPEWTKTVGVEWDEEKEALPDWFSALKPEGAALADEQSAEIEGQVSEEEVPLPEPGFPAGAAWEEEPVIPGEEEAQEQIPDWMRAAGWTPTSGEADTPEEGQFFEHEDEEAEIEPAEMPDWLAGIAPQEQGEAEETGQEAPAGLIEETGAETGEPEGAEFTFEDVSEAAQEAVETFEPADQEPDLAEAALLEESEIPEWLSPVEPHVDEGTLGVEAESVEVPEEEESPGEEPSITEAGPGDIPQDQTEIDEAVSWLEGLAARQGADTDTLTTSPEERGETPPEWVQKISALSDVGEESEIQAEAKPIFDDSESDAEAVAELEDTLAGEELILEDETAVQELEGQHITLPQEEEPLEPFSEEKLKEAEEAVEEMTEEMISSEPFTAVDEPSSPIEDEEPLEELSQAEPDLMSLGIIQETVDVAEEEIAPPTEGISDEESEPDFLQQLQGLELEPEEILVEEPEESVEFSDAMELEEAGSTPAPFEADLPDWLLEAKDESLEDTQPVRVTRAGEETVKPEEEAEWAPLEEQLEEQPPVSGLAADEDVPEWLKEELEFPEEELFEASRPGEPEAIPDFAAEEPAEHTEQETGAEETPEWISTSPPAPGEVLLEIEEPGKEIEPAEAELDEDAAFAWLEGLAARQGADEETLLVPPEEREESPPEWVSQQVQMEAQPEEEQAPAAVEALPSEPTPELPGEWVMQEEATEPEAELPELVPSVEALVQAGAGEDEPQADQSAEAEPVPDWLKGFDKPAGESASDQITEEPPEWLQDLETPQEEPSQQPVPSEWVPEFESQDEKAAEPVLTTPEPLLTQPGETLRAAQAAMEAYNVERALEYYNRLIQSGEHLEEIIHDLRDALYRYPIDIAIWQSLGDAYMRSSRLQEALEAYTKAEELLR